jgi:hypothetical protein
VPLKSVFSRLRSLYAVIRTGESETSRYLRNEIGALRNCAISERARVNTELQALHGYIIPGLQRLEKEVSGLHDYAVQELERLSNEISRFHGYTIPEVARLSEEVSRLHGYAVGELIRLVDEMCGIRKEVSQLHNYAVQDVGDLRDEQRRLHVLVTGRLTTQVECLNRQIYGLKRNLYHSGLPMASEAFNGQFSKQMIFADLCTAFGFDVFVETGANLGFTTQFLSRLGKPVHGVEIDPGFYEEAQERLRNVPNVHLHLGDSPDFLRSLTAGVLSDRELAFFYLDAHWRDYLPLPDELGIIASQHPRGVVMIDDFKVEDDCGYGYDSYANGQEVTLAFLTEELRHHQWQVFFPVLPSDRDHMATDILPPRGTAVLGCEPEIVAGLTLVASLRPWP